MGVDQGDLRRSNAGILELEGGALLATEDDDILAFDTDGTGSCSKQPLATSHSEEGRNERAQGRRRMCWSWRNKCGLTSLHGLHGIFNLEDVPIRAGVGLATPPLAGALSI